MHSIERHPAEHPAAGPHPKWASEHVDRYGGFMTVHQFQNHSSRWPNNQALDGLISPGLAGYMPTPLDAYAPGAPWKSSTGGQGF
jgi:hypothetical protein